MPESRDTAHELHRHYFVVFLTHLDCREDPKVLLRKVTQHIRVQLHRDDRTPRQPKRTNKRCNVVAAAAFGLFFSLSLFLSSQKSAGQIVLDNFVFPERRKKERRLLLASVAASDGGKGIDGVGN